jgi:hypothetical protein
LTKQTQWSNDYAKRTYKRIPVIVHHDDYERIKQAAAGAGHDSINDMILAALEQYTGLEGLRLKGDEKG